MRRLESTAGASASVMLAPRTHLPTGQHVDLGSLQGFRNKRRGWFQREMAASHGLHLFTQMPQDAQE